MQVGMLRGNISLLCAVNYTTPALLMQGWSGFPSAATLLSQHMLLLLLLLLWCR